MRVYVSADIEGVTGIAHWDEADRAKLDYAWFQQRMTAEVGAVCAGAREGGASAITVKDAHASGRNLLPDQLPPGVELVRGWSGSPLSMVQEIDGSYGAVGFVGYHSAATSGGHPLSHTMSGRFARIDVDGQRLSELRLHARTAAVFGVPTAFVSGDAALCEEAAELYPDAVRVPTGRGVGSSVVARPADEVLDELRRGMAAAVRGAGKLRAEALRGPFVLEVRFRVQHEAHRAAHFPGAERVADDRVRLVAAEWLDVPRALLFW